MLNDVLTNRSSEPMLFPDSEVYALETPLNDGGENDDAAVSSQQPIAIYRSASTANAELPNGKFVGSKVEEASELEGGVAPYESAVMDDLVSAAPTPSSENDGAEDNPNSVTAPERNATEEPAGPTVPDQFNEVEGSGQRTLPNATDAVAPVDDPLQIDGGNLPSVRNGNSFKYGTGAPTSFPIEALPVRLGEFVRGMASSLNCPVDFLACALLTVAATLIGRSRKFVVRDGYEIYARIYMAIVGEPGSGKSPAIKAVTASVWKKNNAWHKDFKEKMKEYEKKC